MTWAETLLSVMAFLGCHKMQQTFYDNTKHVPYRLVVSEIFITLVPVGFVTDLAFLTIAALLSYYRKVLCVDHKDAEQCVAGISGLVVVIVGLTVMRALKIYSFLNTNQPVVVPAELMTKFAKRDNN